MAKRLTAIAAALLALALGAPAASSAATFTVNTEVDAAIPDGCTVDPSCSLRDALAAANASPDPADEVVLPAGTYNLTLGALVVSGADLVTLSGAGARTTQIVGDGVERVLEVGGGDAAINDVTIRGGRAEFDPLFPSMPNVTGDGGGILSTGGSLALNRVTITGNSASFNGAGVAAPPENATPTAITIRNSTIHGNVVTGGATEGLGGGVYTFGDLTIADSTITANSVENPGISQGGGVVSALDPAETDGTVLAINNSTIAGNHASAGGIGAGLAIQNPTPAVATTGVTVTNSIVAGNLAGETLTNCALIAVPTTENNLSSDGSCLFTDEGSIENADPQLGSLADNGGPTDTLALQAGSPAIDAGLNDVCTATDQRGIARPQGSACDIGAFERVPNPVNPPPPGSKSADLALTLKAKPKKPKVGDRLAYKVKVRNLGPDPATSAVLKGKLPASTRKIKGGEKCKLREAKGVKRKFTCQLGNLEAGSLTKLKMLARPDENTPKPRATAKVKSSVADPDRSNNRAKAKVEVKGLQGA